MTPEIKRQLLQELGRLGGKARIAGMTPEEISKAASKAGKARWDKARKKARELESNSRAGVAAKKISGSGVKPQGT
jgi:hypothetical protein